MWSIVWYNFFIFSVMRMKKGFLKLGMVVIVFSLWIFFLWNIKTYAETEDTKVTLENCKTNAFSAECSKAYSCEELFQTPGPARTCNYERCRLNNPIGDENDMSNPCNCKYGAGWGWWTVWIPLNTNFPFIGNCLIKKWGDGADDAALSVLPTVLGALSKMLIVIILVVGVIMVIIGGIQWTMGEPKKWQELIKKVAIGFALLGAMSAILALINPNFFK